MTQVTFINGRDRYAIFDDGENPQKQVYFWDLTAEQKGLVAPYITTTENWNPLTAGKDDKIPPEITDYWSPPPINKWEISDENWKKHYTLQ